MKKMERLIKERMNAFINKNGEKIVSAHDMYTMAGLNPDKYIKSINYFLNKSKVKEYVDYLFVAVGSLKSTPREDRYMTVECAMKFQKSLLKNPSPRNKKIEHTEETLPYVADLFSPKICAIGTREYYDFKHRKRKDREAKEEAEFQEFLRLKKLKEQRLQPKKHIFKSNKPIIAENIDDWIKQVRTQSLSNPTRYEKMLYEYLDILGIEYIPQKHIECGGKHYFADAYIPSVNGVIEMDGAYHKNIDQKRKDWIRDYKMKNDNYLVCRCDNSESYNITMFIDKINTTLNLGINAYEYLTD